MRGSWDIPLPCHAQLDPGPFDLGWIDAGMLRKCDQQGLVAGDVVQHSAQEGRIVDSAIQGPPRKGRAWLFTILGIIAIVVALFVLFFFLRDGEWMVARAMALVPLDDRRQARLLGHLADVTRAVVLGSLVTAAAQGLLLGIGFALAGVPSPVFFGVIAVGAALVPMLGTTLVWIPAAIWIGVSGHWGAALFLIVWGVAAVSAADNVIRPLFISSRAKISTLPVFIGLLGGITAFGAIGIFLGPVVIALVLALLEFAEEARSEVAGQ
jgi:predicted PurR-regulated permease PerM